jgi:hypothetical protein
VIGFQFQNLAIDFIVESKVVDDDDFQFQNLAIDIFVEPKVVDDDDDSIFGAMISSEASL